MDRLTEDEKSEVAALIRTSKGDSLEEQVFEHLRKDVSGDEADIKSVLYESDNADAYHSVRKRLIRKIAGQVGAKSIADDHEGFGMVIKWIFFSEKMIQRNASDVARNFLKKSEDWAIENQRFLVLDAVYDVQLTYFALLKLDPDVIHQKMETNFENLMIARKLNIEYSKVVVETQKNKKLGNLFNPRALLEKVFANQELVEHGLNSLDFMYKLVLLVRTKAVISKQYSQFYRFAVKIYNDLTLKKAFFGGAFSVELHFLYVLAQASYRLWMLDDTSMWLNKMDQCFPKDHKERHPLYTRYIQMRAAIQTYTGKADEAIVLLSGTLENCRQFLPPVDILSLHVSLSINHFCLKEYKKANAHLVQINHSNAWLDENIGPEGRFKLQLMDIIYQYDLERPDIAEGRIVSMLKGFEGFLTQPAVARGGRFAKLILKMIGDPNYVTTESFAKEVEAAELRTLESMEDIQAIAFFCWLLSKMQSRDYYQVLREWVKVTRRRHQEESDDTSKDKLARPSDDELQNLD